VTELPSSVLVLDRLDRRIHVALPIRVTYWDEQARPHVEMACTYDISPHGARVMGLRGAKREGDIVAVERGRSKAFCRVVWIGPDDSELSGQTGLQCIESEKNIWEAELRQMEEVYEPILRNSSLLSSVPVSAGGIGSRRRTPRFPIEGLAQLLTINGSATAPLEGPLRNIGEMGCLITTRSALMPGTKLKLVLNVASYDLALRGRVRHGTTDSGTGIEFNEIRKGDRSILQHILRRLAEQQQTDDVPKALVAKASL
jgi:PilZ domain